MQHEKPASTDGEITTPGADAFPARELDEHELYYNEMTQLTRKADAEFRDFKQQMQQNPQLALLALTYMEPHLENFRQHMQLLDTPGYENALIPFNWNIGSSDHEIVGVTPRVMLRRAMYNITTALTTQAMTMGNGRKADTDKLKDLYLAMATARYADEVLNNKGRKGGDKPGPRIRPGAGQHGGARRGAGRPRKNTTSPRIRPVTDITDDEEDGSDEN